MALPVYNTTTSGANSFGTSVSFAHTTTGADKYLNVFVCIRSSSITISSVTHNGNALALVTGSNISTGITIAHYQMVNPDSSGNVVVTISGSGNLIAIANSYTGVNQTTPYGDVQTITATAGTTSQITISSASDELCIDGFGNRNTDTPTITGGQTLRGTVDSASQINASCSEEVGAASTVMSWSMATSGIRKSQSGYAILGAGGAAITPNDIDSAQTISSPSLTQHNIFSVNNIVSAQSISEPTLSTGATITPDPIVNAQTISSPTFTQAHILSVDDLLTGQTLSEVALSVAGALVVDDINSAQTIANIEMIEHNILSVDDINSAQSIGNVTLVSGDQLIVQDVLSSQTISGTSFTQHNVLLVDPITNAQFIGVVNLGGAGQEFGKITVAYKASNDVDYKKDEISVKYNIATFTVKFKE